MDRNYFIGTPEGSNSGGSKFDIMAFLPSLMGGGGKSLDPNLVAALMNNKGNQDAWGGGGCWWIWIILLFFVWGGWGGNGFGNNGANGLPAQLNNDAGHELLMNAIQGNVTAISQLSSSLNCSTQQLQNAICQIQGQIQSVGNQVGMSSQQIINAVQSGNNQLLSQIAECCCTVNNNITKMGYENQLASCNQTNTLVNTMNNNTLTLRDSGLQNTRDIINEVRDFKNLYQQDKMDRLTAENLALKGQISQSNQNAYFAATLQAQTAPLGNALGDLSSRLAKIECNQPEVAKVPYSPVVGIPTCVAAQYGLGLGLGNWGNFGNGWG